MTEAEFEKRQHRLKFETVSVLDNFLECIFPSRCFVCDRLLETADIRRQRNVHAACRKNCIPLCSRTVIIAEARLRIPKQNIVRIAESIVLLLQKDDRFLYIVGLCRNPCTGLSMQTGGDMPVFWRRKPCSAGKTGCGKKDRSHRSGTDVFEKERYRGYNQAALFGRALSEKWIFRVFRV